MERQSRKRTLGVCSWSLQAESPADLARKVAMTGCDSVQLALDPIRRGEWDENETFDRLGEAGIGVASGMMEMAGEDYSSIEAISRTGGVRPEGTWMENATAGCELGEIAARRGIGLVTFHAGFLPHDREDSERAGMLDRLRGLAKIFFDVGVSVGLETGQEDADTLLGVLGEIGGGGVGVNFDPANMLLYGSGDPVEALQKLASHVVQIHIKDATPSPAELVWGEEVVVGTGAVDWGSFLAVANDLLPQAGLMIEREAGGNRIADINAARCFIEARLAAQGKA